MNSPLSLRAVGHASSLLLSVTFLICVAFDLMFPDLAMNSAWSMLLPGFEWLTWKGLLLGLTESYAYGWYIAVIWVPIYNFVEKKGQTSSEITH